MELDLITKILLVEGVAVSLTGLLIIYYVYIRKTVKMKVMAKTGETWRIIKEINAPLRAQKYTWNKEEYLIKLDQSYIDKRLNPVLHYELHKFEPMDLSISTNKFDAKILQDLFDDHDLADLKHGQKERILTFALIGAFVLLVIVVGIAIYYNNLQTDKILELSRKFAEALTNSTKNPNVVVIP